MTDGRIPGKWINEPRFVEMSVDAWCIFTKAIAWSNEAGTDGLVKRRYLGLLHPQGEMPAANHEIAALGLWRPTSDGFQFIDWNKKAHHGGLGQELAAVVQGQKERSKSNQQAYRDRLKGKSDDTAPVTGDVIANVSDHVGQDRKGQASDNEVPFEESFNQETGEVLGVGASWDSAPVEPNFAAASASNSSVNGGGSNGKPSLEALAIFGNPNRRVS